ncbi:unnamed protein product [Cladocopium goreaui]|uniref:Pentatricopeptide repeat-containing protein, mitochondrial n=1 Tax=Cladocopium goreaui TaxID=2562237 RepID=A0A9P1DWQ4_9DINO|nr:unnamed protein product [Cladocopium goreaui]
MTHDQLEADLITFNTLISAVSDRWPLAVHMLEWMEICGLRPDDISHSAVAACERQRAGGWRSSVALLSGGLPAVNAALVALATAWPWAIAGLAGLFSRGAVPDVISYSSSLGDRWRRALSLAKDMATQSLKANLIVQNAIGKSFAGASAWSMAVVNHESLRHRDLQADAYSFSSLVTACRDVWLQAVANLPPVIALQKKRSSVVCNALLAACSEFWQSAMSLMLSMATSAFQLSQITYGSCIAAVGNEVGGWMLAFNMFSKMVSVRLQTNLIVYNSLLSACAQSSQWQLAAYLLMTMQKPDVVSFNSAITACRQGGPVMARSLLQRMREVAIEATLVTWNSCICSCSDGHWQLALHLLHCCMRHLQPDGVTCSAAMNACERGSQWQAALEIYTLSRGDVASSNAFISSCTRGAAWPLGLSLAAAVGDATAVTHGSAVAACAAGGKYLLALNLLSQHPTVSGLGAALDACGSASAWRQALEVLRAARSWTLRADVAACSCAATACARRGWSWALRVLEASPDSLGVQLSVALTVAQYFQIYAILRNGLLISRVLQSKSSKNFKQIRADTPGGHSSTKLGVDIDTYHCNVAIRDCGNWPDALQLLSFLRGRDVRSDTVSFNSLRCRPWRRVLQLHAALPAAQLEPDVVTCGATLSACDGAQQWPTALALLALAPAPGRGTSGISLNSAMSALHRAGEWQKCIEIFYGFPLWRLEPDTFFCNQWQITTAELRRGGVTASGILHDQLLTSMATAVLWQRCLELGRFGTSLVGDSSVVTSLARSGTRHSWAKALLWPKQMQSRFARPNVITFNNLLNACQNGSAWSTSLWLYFCLGRLRLRASSVTLTALARNLRTWRQARALLAGEASVYCLNSAMTSLTWFDMLLLLAEMRCSEILPDAVSLGTFSDASSTPWAHALSLTSVMCRMRVARIGSGSVPKTAQNWRVALFFGNELSAMETAQRWQGAVHLLGEVVSRGDLIFNRAIRACTETGAWQAALAILQQMERELVMPSEISFNCAIAVCAKRHQWQMAVQMMEAMQKAQLVPTAVTWGSVLAACEGLWDLSLHLLRCMSRASIRSDAFAYSSAMTACCKGHEWQRALQLCPLVNDVLSSTAILACAQGAHWRLSLALLTPCVESRVCRNGAVDACAVSKAWKAAVSLLEPPTLLSTNSVLKAVADWRKSLGIFTQSPASCRDLTTYRPTNRLSSVRLKRCSGEQWKY